MSPSYPAGAAQGYTFATMAPRRPVTCRPRVPWSRLVGQATVWLTEMLFNWPPRVLVVLLLLAGSRCWSGWATA